MLQTIREHTQGWIASIIIILLILTFAMWGIHSYLIGGGNGSVVAEVNGVEITKEQLAVAYERLRRQVQIQYGSNPAFVKDETTLKSRALQSLIDTEALKQVSIAQNFRISNQQIDNYLQNLPQFQVDGQFSMEKFQEILNSTLLSTSDFFELIKTSLLIDQPKLGIVYTSFSLPDETDYTVALVNQERDIDYINIPFQYFLTQPINISQDKIKAYYDQHQNEFMTPEQVNVEYIELSLNDIAAKIEPSDAMLKSFYNENINSYTQPMAWRLSSIEIPLAANATREEALDAKNKATAVIAAINKGEDFAKFMKQYPDKAVTSKQMLTLSQVPAELQKSVAGLTKLNQLSEPIRTNQGLVILKVLEMTDPKIQTFEMVKNKVKEMYVHQHAEEKFAELRERLADTTYEHPDSLQFAAKMLNLPIKTSELFSKEKPGKDISQYRKVRETAFSNDVLNVQNNSDVTQLNPETVIVLRSKSHIASTLLPLKDISKQIEDKLKAQEAALRAAQFADNSKAKLESGDDANTFANMYKFTWNKIGYLGRYSNKVFPAIIDTAFSLPNPATVQKKTTYGVTRLQNGYAIVALHAVKQGEIKNDKQFAVFAEQVQNSEGLLEYELYKQSQLVNAKINIIK